MKTLTKAGRALLMGFAWAAIWVPIGSLAGTLMVGEMEPEHVGGSLYPSLLGGALFSAIAGLASGRRRLDEISFSRASVLGAVSGLVIGVLPFTLGGDIKVTPAWILPAIVIGTLTPACALSAVASVWVARATKQAREPIPE
jgi:hypothetical protein